MYRIIGRIFHPLQICIRFRKELFPSTPLIFYSWRYLNNPWQISAKQLINNCAVKSVMTEWLNLECCASYDDIGGLVCLQKKKKKNFLKFVFLSLCHSRRYSLLVDTVRVLDFWLFLVVFLRRIWFYGVFRRDMTFEFVCFVVVFVFCCCCFCGGGGRLEGQISIDPRPVFSLEGHHEQFWHGQWQIHLYTLSLCE